MKGVTKQQSTTRAQREERVLERAGLRTSFNHTKLVAGGPHALNKACEFVMLELHNFPGPVQNEDTSVLDQH